MATPPRTASPTVRFIDDYCQNYQHLFSDSLYGESGSIITLLEKLNLDFIVAIRSNHGVLMPPGQKVRYNRWKAYQQLLFRRQSEPRFVRELFLGSAVSYVTTKSQKAIPLMKVVITVGIL